MNRQAHSAQTVANPHDVSAALKALDRQICASCPSDVPPNTASKLLDAHGQLIADTLETIGEGGIQTVAHALFHDFSHSPAHREAAGRWFEENRREAKK